MTSGKTESKPKLSDEGAKERNCLRCREPFISASAGNRICDSCHRSRKMRGELDIEPYSIGTR